MVNLISGTTTRTGLTVQAEIDTNLYPTGRKITKKETEAIRFEPADFHGEWNYTIYPDKEV
jgi:hypothetical protein